MSAKNEIEIRSWDQLAARVDETARISDRTVLFRGVSSRKYELVPKIGRPDARKDPDSGKSLPHSEEMERRALAMFRRTARSLVAHEPRSALEWLAVAQHFGAPTRLLDWTQSPLVAAYFALEKAGTTGTPGIYVLDAPSLATDDELADPFTMPDVRTYLPPHISPRIQVQRSVFTVHPCPGTAYNPATLTLWFFPEGSPCFEIKRIIDRCGFNRSSLYPDLAGLAEYVGWCYKWSSVVDPPFEPNLS